MENIHKFEVGGDTTTGTPSRDYQCECTVGLESECYYNGMGYCTYDYEEWGQFNPDIANCSAGELCIGPCDFEYLTGPDIGMSAENANDIIDTQCYAMQVYPGEQLGNMTCTGVGYNGGPYPTMQGLCQPEPQPPEFNVTCCRWDGTCDGNRFAAVDEYSSGLQCAEHYELILPGENPAGIQEYARPYQTMPDFTYGGYEACTGATGDYEGGVFYPGQCMPCGTENFIPNGGQWDECDLGYNWPNENYSQCEYGTTYCVWRTCNAVPQCAWPDDYYDTDNSCRGEMTDYEGCFMTFEYGCGVCCCNGVCLGELFRQKDCYDECSANTDNGETVMWHQRFAHGDYCHEHCENDYCLWPNQSTPRCGDLDECAVSYTHPTCTTNFAVTEDQNNVITFDSGTCSGYGWLDSQAPDDWLDDHGDHDRAWHFWYIMWAQYAPCSENVGVEDIACVDAFTQPVRADGTSAGTLTMNDGASVTGFSMTYTPSADFNQVAYFTYRLVHDWYPHTIYNIDATLTVSGADDNPTCSTVTASVIEDSFAADNPINIGCTINVYETVEYTIEEDVSYGTLDVTNIPNLTYEPNDNFNGTDFFVYKAWATDGGTTTKTVNITVNPDADAPTCETVAVTMNEGESVDIEFNCTAQGSTHTEDAIHHYTVSDGSPGGGMITGCSTYTNCPGTVTFSPPSNDWNTGTSFTYTACTEDDTCSDSTVVTISVVGGPDAPSGCTPVEAGPFDEGSTGNEITISCIPPVFETIVNYTVYQADIGTLQYNDGSAWVDISASGTEISGTTATLKYTPSTDQNVEDEFHYIVQASDLGQLAVDTPILITAGADSPICNNVSATVDEESENILLSIECEPPNAYEEITGYEITVEPGHGTLNSASAPTLFYTPTPNYWGPDSFEYTATASDEGTTDVVFEITVEDVSDQPTWHWIEITEGAIPGYEFDDDDVDDFIAQGIAIWEDTDGQISFEVQEPPGYSCTDIEWSYTVEDFYGTLDFQGGGFGCEGVLNIHPYTRFNTYMLSGTDYVDVPASATISATPDEAMGGVALSLTFSISVMPVGNIPSAPIMYASQDYNTGMGMTFWDNEWMSFIWHPSGIDPLEPGSSQNIPMRYEEMCGDGVSGPAGIPADCIYDRDPYDNNIWWEEEHKFICPGWPENDHVCTSDGQSCGPETCKETTPISTYLAVMIVDYNNTNHGGDDGLGIPKICDNALTPLWYTQNDEGEIAITQGMLPFTFPSDSDTDIPYFFGSAYECIDNTGNPGEHYISYDCSCYGLGEGVRCGPLTLWNEDHYEGAGSCIATGIESPVNTNTCDLRLSYWCENWGWNGQDPYNFEIFYKVVECMYFTTDNGTVKHWGQPYCAESDRMELEWYCDDDNPLKCSTGQYSGDGYSGASLMWAIPSGDGTIADWDLDSRGRDVYTYTFQDTSDIADDEFVCMSYGGWNPDPNNGICPAGNTPTGAPTIGYNWNFGDTENNTAIGETTSHTFSGMGRFTVTLSFTVGNYWNENLFVEKIRYKEMWIGNIGQPWFNEPWMLVSVPVEAPDMTSSALFPNSIPNTLYGFNAGYGPIEELEVGKGYWLRFRPPNVQPDVWENISIVGGIVPTIAGREIKLVDLVNAWNLVGGLTDTIDFYSDALGDPDGIVIANTLWSFGYDFGGGYQQEDEINPGQGYWLRTNSAGTISIHELIEE